MYQWLQWFLWFFVGTEEAIVDVWRFRLLDAIFVVFLTFLMNKYQKTRPLLEWIVDY